jgi:phosphatidylinositol alpha-1,6-mannosyltransferase
MPHRPRLLLITPDFPPARGGIQVLAHRLASGLAGFDVTVVARDSSGSAEFDAGDRLDIRRVSADPRLRGGRNLLLNAGAMAHAAHLRPAAVLSAHLVTSPAAAVISRLLGVPTVQYFHAKEVGAKPRLAAFAAERASVSVAVSRYTADLIAATGAQDVDIRLIPPGVDLPAEIAPLAAERPTVLTIARLEDRYKGHDVLIRALPLVRAEVPKVHWVVIGDGPLRAGLEQLAYSHGVADAISFLGVVSDVERDGWLRRANLLAMPSRVPAGGFAGEGFGIVYLEAASYGKPVVAGNVAGALDAVVDGETGLLVDPADHLAVAGTITRLLTDDDLARKLGARGAQRAQEFSWPVICARVEALLMEHIGSRFARPGVVEPDGSGRRIG